MKDGRTHLAHKAEHALAAIFVTGSVIRKNPIPPRAASVPNALVEANQSAVQMILTVILCKHVRDATQSELCMRLYGL
jgi:hypothetical protein